MNVVTADDQWAATWLEDVSTIKLPRECLPSLSFEQSAAKMRELLKSRQLLLTDLRDRPERFFLAHKLLATACPTLGPGFWIRFTVQYNLFAGTILAVAGPDQLQRLEEIQDAGHLGCFALTEKLAGVNSGLVVHTRAEWDDAAQEFRLDTPDEGAHKNWISQGYTADKAVVVADLIVSGRAHGPHAFLIDLRRGGELVPGVQVGDMGLKSTGGGLFTHSTTTIMVGLTYAFYRSVSPQATISTTPGSSSRACACQRRRY
jgi:acyl-CoA oxidase